MSAEKIVRPEDLLKGVIPGSCCFDTTCEGPGRCISCDMHIAKIVDAMDKYLAAKLADSILITREQLKSLEWGRDEDDPTCPVCGNSEKRDASHTETCWIGRALGEKRG